MPTNNSRRPGPTRSLMLVSRNDSSSARVNFTLPLSGGAVESRRTGRRMRRLQQVIEGLLQRRLALRPGHRVAVNHLGDPVVDLVGKLVANLPRLDHFAADL